MCVVSETNSSVMQGTAKFIELLGYIMRIVRIELACVVWKDGTNDIFHPECLSFGNNTSQIRSESFVAVMCADRFQFMLLQFFAERLGGESIGAGRFDVFELPAGNQIERFIDIGFRLISYAPKLNPKGFRCDKRKRRNTKHKETTQDG